MEVPDYKGYHGLRLAAGTSNPLTRIGSGEALTGWLEQLDENAVGIVQIHAVPASAVSTSPGR